MNDLLGVTLDDLVASLTSRRVRVPAEIGAFVVLETCEALLSGPAIVTGRHIRISDEGAVGVFAPPSSATTEEAARSLSALLAGLLVAAGTGVPNALIQLVEEGAKAERGMTLNRLKDELEASLVPLNRGASRRVLSRMIREARRASIHPDAELDALLEAGGVPEQHLDRALDELLGADDAPAAGRHTEATAEALVSGADAPAQTAPPPLSEPFSEPEAGKRSSPPPRFAPPPEPALPKGPTWDDHDSHLDALPAGEGAPRGRPVLWLLAFAALFLATTAGVALTRPDLVDRVLGRPPVQTQPIGPTDEERAAALLEHRARFGTLTVTSAPPRAQVLLYIGQGPAIATDLPTGMAYEFVTLAEGRTPSRAIVPADAVWEESPSGPRYELAMQTGPQLAPGAELVLGPTTLPRDALGAPSTSLGSVRVLTTPPGAKVYLLVGFTPDVRVENVRTDRDSELLLELPGHLLERVQLTPSDWQADGEGGKRAELSITLTPRPSSPRRR